MAHVEDRWAQDPERKGHGKRWRVRYRDPAGHHRTKAFDRKQDAERYAATVAADMALGSWTDPQRARVTFGEYATRWVESKRATVKPSTAAGYDTNLRSRILPRWSDVPLSAIEHSDVAAWIGELTKRGLSPSAVRQAHVLMGMILDTAVRDRRIVSNPARGVDLPRVPMRRQHTYLGHLDVARLAKATNTPRDEALMLTLAYCGLRWGEATALRVADFDELRSRLIVHQAFSQVNGAMILGTPKTHQRREVPVPAVLAERLVRLCAEAGAPDAFIFHTRNGTPLRNQNWRREVFDPACKAAGITGITPHGLRHTAASLAVASGGDVKVIQHILGHARASMTLDVYADLFPQALDDVAERMNAEARGALG